MDSKEEGNDGESLIMNRETLLKLQQNIEKASESSTFTSADLQNLSDEIKLHLMKTANVQDQSKTDPSKTDPSQTDPSKATYLIRDELDMLFAAEEVGHSCDLCQRDLASDPERPNASLRSLQEACVLACGHVYHFKCLKGTTLDLDNGSTNPSCIFCIS